MVRQHPINVIRADHLGMCFGVRDAIELAFRHAESAPLTILGDLVHNDDVLAALRSKGITTADQAARVTTQTVMVTAHGASERAMARTRALGLEIVEATCPLVKVAHRAIDALVRDGYHPVIIGQRNHVEVRGLTEDLDAFDVVLDESDVLTLEGHPRMGIAAQTTQPIDKVRSLAALIRQRFPHSEVRFFDTVCRPTKERQHSAVELARRADVVIVIGGAKSNNTRELVNTCRQHCSDVHHVHSEADLRAEWFLTAECVGITAGTSTPDDVIDRVERHIRELSMAPAECESQLASERS